MPATNPKSTAAKPVPLVMHKNDGTFTLKFRDKDGKLKSIPHVGESVAPFEIYQPFFGDYIVVRKFTRSVYSKFYLVDPRTGQIAKQSIHGIERVKIDKKLGRFLIRTYYAGEKSSISYKTVSLFAGTETISGYWIDDLPDVTKYTQIELEPITINTRALCDQIPDAEKRPVRRPRPEKVENVVPKRSVDRPIQIITETVALKRPIGRPKKVVNPEIVIEKRPRGRPPKIKTEAVALKRPIGRPKKVVNPETVIEKRPRGRPKGSTNKPKTQTLVQEPVIQAPVIPIAQNRWEKPQPKQDTLFGNSNVKIKQTKRVLDGIYSDVFINNNKVLTKQLNVEPQLLLNDRILALTVGIEGKDDTEIKLFYANGAQWKTQHKDRLSGNSVRIIGVADYEAQLKIALSNGAFSWVSERDAGLLTTKKFEKIDIQEIKALADRPMKQPKKKGTAPVTAGVQNNAIPVPGATKILDVQPAPEISHNKNIRLVRTEAVQIAPNKFVYNVSLNGLAVVSRHVAVTVKTFFDGALLGVRGIDLRNVMGNGTHEWKLFLPDETRWIPTQDRGGYTTIVDIQEMGSELRLKLSNSKYLRLHYRNLVRENQKKKYIIER